MTEFLLIRHGESEHNASRIWQGHLDAPLSARGREQGQQLAARLAHAPPDVLYTSDLSRAFDTARAIAGVCNLPIHPEFRLREVDLGHWSGKPYTQIERAYPDEWARFTSGDPHLRRGGGESAYDVQRRVVAVLDEIATRHPEQRVAVVSHGFALGAYLVYLLGLPLECLASRVIRLANGSLTRVHPPVAGQPGVILCLNDTCHLDAHVPV